MKDLSGKTVAIVGLARSGLAAAKLCAKMGARVIASDGASEKALTAALDELHPILIDVETGGNSVEFLSRADLVIVSPGVPLAIQPLQALKTMGKSLASEVEVASWFVNCPIVGITGSNGKTTTTALTGQMLRDSGLAIFVGGNIGTALSELPLSGMKCDVAVVELSSFQLEAVDTFRVRAAGLLNITVDHMDRYPDFEAYANAKMNLIRSLDEEGAVVCNAKDPQCSARCNDLIVPAYWFGKEGGPGAWMAAEKMLINDAYGQVEFSLNKFALLGAHNQQNAMAAALLARRVGASNEGIQRALDTFAPLSHRIEPVAEVRGVKIYNDSKSTSVDSVITALRSFEGRVIVLLGGRNKGAQFNDLEKVLEEKAKAVFCFGEAGTEICRSLNGSMPRVFAGNLEAAVEMGFGFCEPGDVLLLSPGCASFDAFRNYEHRGDYFKELVRGLS